MREIKFRGKRKDTNEWMYGNHYGAGRESLESFWMAVSDELIDRETVGQFTGLHDSTRTKEFPNGKEIYEGSIVNFKYEPKLYGVPRSFNGVVEWDTCNPTFVIKEISGKGRTEYDFIICDLVTLTVIGNIHENPELLKT